jgi:hypothetical protein
VSSWPMAKAEPRSPFAPPHYRAFHATTGCSAPAVLSPCGWSRLRLLPSRHRRDRAQVLTFRTKAGSNRAAYMPDVAQAVSGTPLEWDHYGFGYFAETHMP